MSSLVLTHALCLLLGAALYHAYRRWRLRQSWKLYEQRIAEWREETRRMHKVAGR